MGIDNRLIVIGVIAFLFISVEGSRRSGHVQRSISVDYENNQFLKDGKPFRFIGGSFHYFRALPETWQRKLRTMRSAGLNVVTTYVEWMLHNPTDGFYTWDGIADLERFIQLAAQEDLLVILRPGPYICAERDNGGFPHWLFYKYPNILLRTSDQDYLNEVRKWYNILMPKMYPYLYENGGPIIMVQVENEYGSYSACDRNYSIWLKHETESHVQNKAILFTNDGPVQLKCGKIDGVLAALDFGAGDERTISNNWRTLRKYEPRGPLVNAEYYPGWLTHWREPLARVETSAVLDSLRLMLNSNASVNFYMFYGGTNFGFTAGANDGGPGRFQADITSYDYDAPMDESGDPTSKFMALRDVILQYLPDPNVTVPSPLPKMTLTDVYLTPCATLLSDIGRRTIGKTPVFSPMPLPFEALNQFSGFVLYETHIPRQTSDPSTLIVEKLRDRAHVFIDGYFIGILSRENLINTIPISANFGNRLQILVESQGRINFNIANDFKGILGNVKLDGLPLSDWTITGYPLDNYSDLMNIINQCNIEILNNQRNDASKIFLRSGPTVYHAKFHILAEADDIKDTYLNPSDWGKGIVYINGFNLGRYWPNVGPQITLYLPKELLKTGENELIIIELQSAPTNGIVTFSDIPYLDNDYNANFRRRARVL